MSSACVCVCVYVCVTHTGMACAVGRAPVRPRWLLSLVLLWLLGAAAPAAASVILLNEAVNVTYVDRASLFGPRVNASGVVGVLVPMADLGNEDGCSNSTATPALPSGTAWIALVKRNVCAFADKAGERYMHVRMGRDVGGADVLVRGCGRCGPCSGWARRAWS
jgi:hypothetical protein